MKPYYEGDGITIFHADFRDVMRYISFEAIVCDPPYGLNRELSTDGARIEGDHSTDIRDAVISYQCPKIIFGSPKVERPSGIRQTLIWDKSELTGMGDLDFPWKLTHEEVYIIGEGFRSDKRRGSVLRHPLRPSWSNHPDSISGIHPTEKPVSLMVDLLLGCPWVEICDPCAGVGSTLQAAKNLGKLCIGIEVEERYCEAAANRLRQSVLNFEGVA